MYCLYFRMCYFGLIIVVLVATNTFIPGTYYAREAFCIACMGFSPGSFLLPNGIFYFLLSRAVLLLSVKE